MTDRALVTAARGILVLTTALLLAALAAVATLARQGLVDARSSLPEVLFAIAVYSFPVVGVIIARRQPRNAIGWLLLGVGLAWQVSSILNAYAQWQWLHNADVAGAMYADAVSQVLWLPGLGLVGTFVLLLFPDGRLPTPAWRRWAQFCALVIGVGTLASVFASGEVESAGPAFENPLALPGFGALSIAAIVALPFCIIGCAAALVRRFRRSRGIERLQLKWLAAAAGSAATIYLITMVATVQYPWELSAPNPLWVHLLQNGSMFAFVLVPAAVGVAILRYRLYDIDRLINRALVYGGVSALLAGVYALGVVAVGTALRAITGSEQGNLAVAGSTLAVAALFGPLRARVQRFIDRRFYRRKYDAAQTVEAFSVRLRQETDLSTLTEELREVVAQTVQPATVEIWITTVMP
jgi:hypothetical protein